jgi:epoxyqueuosine reductase QueG
LEALILHEIRQFVLKNPANRFPGTEMPFFEAPIIGFARANDPLFTDYKHIIGDFHLTPGEIMQQCWGSDLSFGGSVICWVLPISETTRLSNRQQTRIPSLEWALTRDHGETFNNLLRRHLTSYLISRDCQAISPLFSEIFKQIDDPVAGLASTWSERHAAYAAGLGTFSLNGGLITSKGMAHRCGSIITDLDLPPTPRPYDTPRSYCLFFREGHCGKCIDRCPVGAFSTQGHDKNKCLNYAYKTINKAFVEQYGIQAPGCGLCQTGTPCEAGIPKQNHD